MRTRDKFMKDYGISEKERETVISFCRNSNEADKQIIKWACHRANPDIEKELYNSLTEGIGYDGLSAKKYIPIGRKDFYGYQRKALYFLDEYLQLIG